MKRRRIAGSRGLLRLTTLAGSAALGVLMAGSGQASADPSLSSIVLSHTLPGMVQAPLGSLNGPLTADEVQSIAQGAGPELAGPSADFAQGIRSGQLSTYVRTWLNDPPNGAFVQIFATQFPDSNETSQALAGANSEITSRPFGHFPVNRIPHAHGYTLITNAAAGVVNEEIVVFAKGSILFEVSVGQITTAANGGATQLSEDNAIEIALQQSVAAPGSTLSPSNSAPENSAYQLGLLLGYALLLGGIVWLVVFLVRRPRRLQPPMSPAVSWSEPTWPPPTPGLTTAGAGPGNYPGPGAAPSPPRTVTALLDRPQATSQPGFYCSWCGAHVSIGEPVPHDCGQRDARAAYCMACGAAFGAEAARCASCGTPKLQ